MVLLKHADERGFVFYTNLESAKSADLKANPQAELCFYWGPLTRQVRITGPVERTTDAEADAYFATRPRLSQIGAWASQQSRPMRGGYFELEQACARVALRYPFGAVPRPPFWSGYRVVPERIEFWKQKPFRRHERVVYIREAGRNSGCLDPSSGWYFRAEPLRGQLAPSEPRSRPDGALRRKTA